jgi:hypothetical protein
MQAKAAELAGANLSLASIGWAASSSFNGDFAGDKAYDGVVSAASKWTSDGSGAVSWLALDLGAIYEISGFVVRHAGAGGEPVISNIRAYGLESGSSLSGPWATLATVDNAIQQNITTTVLASRVNARYVRLYITDAGVDNYARIPEFEVYGLEPDSEVPSVAITAPTGDASYSTDTDTISLAGAAGDNIGVTEVGWANDRGGSGTCSGTTNWSAAISLLEGSNVITITARDTAGNLAQDTLTVTFTPPEPDPDPDPDPAGIPACDVNIAIDYSGGFDEEELELLSVAAEDDHLVLQTGAQAINPDRIIIPFEQEVWVSFFYSKTAHEDDFGWFLGDDAVVDGNGILDYTNTPKHALFRNIHDGNVFVPIPGDGILDSNYGNGSFPYNDEAALATYDDGSGYPFIVDGDGIVSSRDMKKRLGTFSAGSEIVFFLAGNQDWNDPAVDPDWVFYTKTAWNRDTYVECDGLGSFDKIFHLEQVLADSAPCQRQPEGSGWLEAEAFNRLAVEFNVSLSGDYILPLTVGAKYSHVIVGAPSNDPKQWILGWEGVNANEYDTDLDNNDLVFRIERRTGGTVQLKPGDAIVPPQPDLYYTAVNIAVYDKIDAGICLDKNNIVYHLSIDGGANWVEINGWDEIKEFSLDGSGNKIVGAEVPDWSPGSPEMTYRARRVDFSGLGLTGRELVWKATMTSDDDRCIPEIIDLELDSNIAGRGIVSRSSPVVLANLLYSGSYETPAPDWTDQVNRGHLTATRLYDSTNPDATAEIELWDAGAVLNSMSPAARTIYFPDLSVTEKENEVIDHGDGSTKTFKRTLNHHPLLATSVTVGDQFESFHEGHSGKLVGSFGGTGTINNFSGEFSITFKTAPMNGRPIKANYSYYDTPTRLQPFTDDNVSNAMLALDDSQILPEGYVYDFDGDNHFKEKDGDWLVNWVRGYRDGDGKSDPKEWLLAAVDHSTPAVVTPPGNPPWLYGSAITKQERKEYVQFKEIHKTRPTVVFVGAKDGMLHAFDGGAFRHGDNPETETDTIIEKRGYFAWTDSSADCPDYCSDRCDQCPQYGSGEELWAFIPANLIPRLKNNRLKGENRSYVDASPALADVHINGAWRTVLISAEGIGGDTIFCLDVTDPTSPVYLWEFGDPDLFRSRSSPSVGKIGRILVGDTARWVAFFVSGKTYDQTQDPSIYLINIADGSLIQRIYLDAEPAGAGGVPSGQPTIVDSDGNGYIDRLYIGTDKGYAYKVNFPDDPDTVKYGSSHCVINKDFADESGNVVTNQQQYHPIYGSPVVIIDNSINQTGHIDYDVMVFFGTGDSPYYDEDIDVGNTRYHFFAYRDQTPKGQCDDNSVSLDWVYELEESHRVFSSAFVSAGRIYFGTSTADTEDPCESGGGASVHFGKIFAFDVAGSKKFEQTVGSVVVPPVVSDEHLYIKSQTQGLTSFGTGKYNNPVVVGGLPQVRPRSWREFY